MGLSSCWTPVQGVQTQGCNPDSSGKAALDPFVIIALLVFRFAMKRRRLLLSNSRWRQRPVGPGTLPCLPVARTRLDYRRNGCHSSSFRSRVRVLMI
jgi:hypothetical protein